MIWSWTSDSWRFCGQWFSLSSKTSYSAAENEFVPEQVTAEEPVANDTVYPTRQNPSCSAAGMSSSVITGTFFSVKFIHFWHFLFVNLYSQVILGLSGPRGFIWQLMFFTLTYNCVISLSNVFIVSCTLLYCHLEVSSLVGLKDLQNGVHFVPGKVPAEVLRPMIVSVCWGTSGQW